MNRRNMLTMGCLLSALLINSISVSQAQTQSRKGNMKADEILAAVKPGQWAKLEGFVQKDFSALCKQVEILTGDFLDDDWTISAVVQRVDKEKKEFTVMRIPIKLNKDAELKSGNKVEKAEKAERHKAETQAKSERAKRADRSKARVIDLEDLKVGMLLEIEGTYLKDGSFLALQMDDESTKLEAEPELKDEVEMVGKVEKVDPVQRTITMMGITFRLTERTKGKSVIK